MVQKLIDKYIEIVSKIRVKDHMFITASQLEFRSSLDAYFIYIYIFSSYHRESSEL